MSSLVDRLVSYAEYHRDRRNIATHFVGIPMIVLGTQAALAKVGVGPANAAVAATGFATKYYRNIDATYGAAMGTVLGVSCGIATGIAALPLPMWAGVVGGLFFGGWAIQFLGHYFEGRKPAFMDDMRGLLDGPLFLVAETAFAFGLSRNLRDEVVRRAGPTRWGKVAAPVTLDPVAVA